MLLWGLDHFGAVSPSDDKQPIALATGFGPEGVVLMHMVSRLAPDVSVFYTDTDLLFEETYALRDALSARLGLSFTRVHSGLSLTKFWFSVSQSEQRTRFAGAAHEVCAAS